MLKRLCTGEYIKAQPGFVLRWLYSGVFLIPYYYKLNTVSYCFYEAVVLGVQLFLDSVISVYCVKEAVNMLIYYFRGLLISCCVKEAVYR